MTDLYTTLPASEVAPIMNFTTKPPSVTNNTVHYIPRLNITELGEVLGWENYVLYIIAAIDFLLAITGEYH